MTPCVSILLQTYNQARYLTESVDSLLSQTCQDFELVIVDDCSPDETQQVLQNYKDHDRVTAVRNARNLGQHASTNLHLSDLSGEFVLFASGDDLYYPRLIERQLGIFEREASIALVHANGLMIDPESQPIRLISDWYAESLVPDAYSSDIAAMMRHDYIQPGRLFQKHSIRSTRNLIASHSTCLVRRASLDAAGPFDETQGQVGDWDMWLRLAEHGDVGYVAEPLVGWRQHAASESTAARNSGRGRRDVIRLVTRSAQRYAECIEDFDRGESSCYGNRCLFWAMAALDSGLVSEARVLMMEALRARARSSDEPPATARSSFAQRIVYEVRSRFDFPEQTHEALGFLDSVYTDLLSDLPVNASRAQVRSFFWVVDAFEAWRGRQRSRTLSSVSRALLARPTWLRNRGLGSIALQALLVPRVSASLRGKRRSEWPE